LCPRKEFKLANTKIAQLRVQNNWTQNDVANMIGITKAAYSNIETGKRNPSFNIIIKLQRIFNDSIDRLLIEID